MQLSISGLKEMGAFTGRPVEREIKWSQSGKDMSATVFVRPLGYRTAVNDVLSATGKVESYAGRIAASICDELGQPVFTVGDITGDADPERGALDGNLTVALMMVIAEVNNMGKTTSSVTPTSSGTKSPSRSAPRSRRPKKD